jgi:hypothetical protein
MPGGTFDVERHSERENPVKSPVTIENILGLIAALALAVYLIVAIRHAERF